jgi:protein involved in polysaccharide export with SLBB domain
MEISVGDTIRVSLSDAPEFTAVVDKINDDGKFGLSYVVTRRNGRKSLIGAARIVSKVNGGTS